MKKFLLIAALILISAGFAQAQVVTGTFGDQNSSKAYRMQVDTNGTVTYASDSSILYPYVTYSTNQTLTSTQTGITTVFNNGTGVAASGTTFTLPTAAVGMQYAIIADVAKWFFVRPQATDTINFSTATAGQRISNSATAAAGDSITLFCATANKWSLLDKNGTWAVGPGQ